MVVTPHPDDAEYGVAGTVVHWVSQGKEIVYVVCTNGDKGTSDAEHQAGGTGQNSRGGTNRCSQLAGGEGGYLSTSPRSGFGGYH